MGKERVFLRVGTGRETPCTLLRRACPPSRVCVCVGTTAWCWSKTQEKTTQHPTKGNNTTNGNQRGRGTPRKVRRNGTKEGRMNGLLSFFFMVPRGLFLSFFFSLFFFWAFGPVFLPKLFLQLPFGRSKLVQLSPSFQWYILFNWRPAGARHQQKGWRSALAPWCLDPPSHLLNRFRGVFDARLIPGQEGVAFVERGVEVLWGPYLVKALPTQSI